MLCHCAKNMLELAKRILLTEPTCVLCFHHFTLKITAVKTRTQIERGHHFTETVLRHPPAQVEKGHWCKHTYLRSHHLTETAVKTPTQVVSLANWIMHLHHTGWEVTTSQKQHLDTQPAQVEKGHWCKRAYLRSHHLTETAVKTHTGSLAGQPNNAPSPHRLREVTTSQKQCHLYRLRKVTDPNVRIYALATWEVHVGTCINYNSC